ncbi:Hypp3170 [Branchiostoma lanceolatum]|uniref:Hypp3170 protein n=1 Tax=Branchiostoma lanceolatum TaxID=7740 RepID=A0A8K0EW20_BRALA|nr:Hypp3170 [Branchiostoma lanceolatum]
MEHHPVVYNYRALDCPHKPAGSRSSKLMSGLNWNMTFLPYQKDLIYSTLLYSTLLYSTLLYSTLLYSTLLYSTLLYSTLLYSTLE